MPTYDYRCDSCGYRFEQFQLITSTALKTCPNCKRRTLQRLIGSGGGILFKGSGFYQTDYRSESYKKAADAEKKAASGGAAGEDKATKPTGEKPAPKRKSSAPARTGSRGTRRAAG